MYLQPTHSRRCKLRETRRLNRDRRSRRHDMAHVPTAVQPRGAGSCAAPGLLERGPQPPRRPDAMVGTMSLSSHAAACSPDIFREAMQQVCTQSSGVFPRRTTSAGGPLVRVTVAASGHKLAGHDLNLLHGRTGDPYLVFESEGQELARTEIVHNNLNPVWRPFMLALRPHDELRVRCYDSDHFSADDLVGEAIVPVERLLAEGAVEVTLHDQHRNSGGTIKLQIDNVITSEIGFLQSVLSDAGKLVKSGRVLKRVSEREVTWIKRSMELHENVIVLADPKVPPSRCGGNAVSCAEVWASRVGLCNGMHLTGLDVLAENGHCPRRHPAA